MSSIKNDLPPEYIGKNLKYLREKVHMSINELAEVIDIDPLIIFEIERDNHFSDDAKTNQDEMIAICNYFALTLDNLVYEDLETNQFLKDDFVEQLKRELSQGQRANRKDFNNALMGDYLPIDNHASTKETLKRMLWQIHQLYRLRQRYFNLRIKGEIERIDFFE